MAASDSYVTSQCCAHVTEPDVLHCENELRVEYDGGDSDSPLADLPMTKMATSYSQGLEDLTTSSIGEPVVEAQNTFDSTQATYPLNVIDSEQACENMVACMSSMAEPKSSPTVPTNPAQPKGSPSALTPKMYHLNVGHSEQACGYMNASMPYMAEPKLSPVVPSSAAQPKGSPSTLTPDSYSQDLKSLPCIGEPIVDAQDTFESNQATYPLYVIDSEQACGNMNASMSSMAEPKLSPAVPTSAAQPRGSPSTLTSKIYPLNDGDSKETWAKNYICFGDARTYKKKKSKTTRGTSSVYCGRKKRVASRIKSRNVVGKISRFKSRKSERQKKKSIQELLNEMKVMV